MLVRPVKYWDLVKILKKFGLYIDTSRGKGSERMIVKGNPPQLTYPIPFRTENDDVKRCYIRVIRQKFKLTPEDGVPDQEFYG